MATSSETASRFGKWLGAVRRWAGKPRPAPLPSRSIGLALGGGFARGISHVGVLRVLEKYQIPIAYIAGVSAGSIVAAAYASGTSVDEIAKICACAMPSARDRLPSGRVVYNSAGRPSQPAA